MLALVGLFLALFGCGGGASGPLVIDVVQHFGASADGFTDDEPAIQSALDLAARLGGGTVYLPAGTYGIGRPLVVGTNVNLRGETRVTTTVRAISRSLGKHVGPTGVWAAVATVAAANVSISDLTIDLSYAASDANGIALLPAGDEFQGTVSSNCEIIRVGVIGGGDYHAYMIWNMRGENIRIVDNFVDGGVVERTLTSYQEGIESYGGTNVVVANNIIQNVGNTALNFGSAGLPDTGIAGLEVKNNFISNVGRGVNIGSWMDSSGPQNIVNVNVASNTLSDIWWTGMYVYRHPGTRILQLLVADNTLQNIGSTDTVGAVGLHLNGAPHSGETSEAEMQAEIRRNRVDSVRGANAIGVLLTFFSDVDVEDNTITNVDTIGIQATGASRLTVINNEVLDIGQTGIVTQGHGSTVLLQNRFERWNLSKSGSPGVSISGSHTGEVLFNAFVQNAPTGSAVRVESNSIKVIVFGNTVDAPEVLAVPFVNLGLSSNIGSFSISVGMADASVADPQVNARSKVRLWSSEGLPLTYEVHAGDQQLLIDFGGPLTYDGAMHYEVIDCDAAISDALIDACSR